MLRRTLVPKRSRVAECAHGEVQCSLEIELNVTVSRVHKMIAAKRLKATKLGNGWLIDPKDFEAVQDRKVGRPRKTRKRTKK